MMGPLAALFERKSPTRKQQSTLGVQLPNPTPLPNSTVGDYDWTSRRRSFGPRLPSYTYAPPQAGRPPLPACEAGPSRDGPSVPLAAAAPSAQPHRPESPPSQPVTLSERVAALRLRGDESSAPQRACPPPIPARPPCQTPQPTARTGPDGQVDIRNQHIAGSTVPYSMVPRSWDAELPSSAHIVGGGAPPAYTPFSTPARMPRHSISRDVPPPSSSQRTFPAASRNPLAPFPYPRPPSHSHSAPVLGRSPNGTPKCSQKQDSFSRERQTSGAASPALLASRSASGAENSAPLRKVRTASAPTTPQTQRPSRINSPSSPSTSARSSAGRKKAVSETRQCSGITATSKRCTRMVSLAAWQLSTAADGASSPIRPAQSASTPETDSEPVYCRQHAKLALADSGCFVVQRNLPTSNREHWVKFAGASHRRPAHSAFLAFAEPVASHV